jgi:hypothetical protein
VSLLFCIWHFRTGNSTPLISISRHLAPFDKFGWKVITLKGLFQILALVRLWVSERSRIIDPTSLYFSHSRMNPHDNLMYLKNRALSSVILRSNSYSTEQNISSFPIYIFMGVEGC